MKHLMVIFFVLYALQIKGQSLQLHYDARHAIDPENNPKNFVSVQFEYLKQLDTGKTFIKPGTFLLKLQADMSGDQSSIGKCYMQVSQEVRFWKPRIFINLQYSGGLGVTYPRQYSYYIQNTYQVGVSYPFKIGKGYFSSVLNYKYISYKKPSHDFFYTLYFYQGLWNYKVEFAGDFSFGTENRNHGDEFTASLHGKRFIFFAEPQLWYNINKSLACGTRLNLYYHILSPDNRTQAYPTLGIRAKL
ncbi:DUF5020 family protein [Mucilaginibacter sp. 14171R-50]|uniref:DUF5020 family protein n=1 Tax=Mucilaginibacter sp. 14171R-50 TaxID=2703789 RepID=UPI00138BD6A1|nr:DUF5020 family protein [Mucilaginibacter sp. 14171R-50]QHS54192.1 DUF5020 family protein [Mucilaginibacter sp. 14171R-50]